MKCLALCSGGLDSALAVFYARKLGFEVEAVNFTTSFEPGGGNNDHARLVAESLEVKLHRIVIRDAFLEILRAPRFGYGKNLNPCIDCKILMLKEAWKLARTIGAEFLVTGDVLGQRPMSQQEAQLRLIEKCAGLSGYIFRPLSAGLLPETRPEKNGLVRRDRLPVFSGRGRRGLLALAAENGITGYGAPAGGCLLTDRIFSRRLKDLLDHGRFVVEELDLLNLGRHYRLSPGTKLVLGRDERENRRLLHAPGDRPCLVTLGRGPVGLLCGAAPEPALLRLAAGLVASFSDEAKEGRPVAVALAGPETALLEPEPLARDKREAYLI
jgi:hypothetical protein